EVSHPLADDLPAGEYSVDWRVVSADGHPISGEFTFTVTEQAAVGDSPESTDSPDASDTASATETATPGEDAPSGDTASADSNGSDDGNESADQGTSAGSIALFVVI